MTTTPQTVDVDRAEDPGEPDALTQASISLTFDFLRAGFDDPTLLLEVPDGAVLVLLPEDDPELTAVEIELGLAALKRGRNVYFRHVRGTAPSASDDVAATG